MRSVACGCACVPRRRIPVASGRDASGALSGPEFQASLIACTILSHRPVNQHNSGTQRRRRRNVRTVRVLLRLKKDRRNPANTSLFENADTEEGFILRTPRGRLHGDIEFVPFEMNVDTSGAAGGFILFLREVVRREPARPHPHSLRRSPSGGQCQTAVAAHPRAETGAERAYEGP